MNKCTSLYKKFLRHKSTKAQEEKYKTYRNCLTKIKHTAKVKYYIQHCYTLKSNMSKLWQLINNIIKKTNDKTAIIDHITIDNIKYYEANEISNHFGLFYAKLGENIVKSINTKNLTSYYPQKIPTNSNTLFLHDITPEEIKRHINSLPSKNGSGYDNISNKLLKSIKYFIYKPTNTYFQSII